MATTSQIRQLQTPDHLVDVYPITLEDCVSDREGVQLDMKLTVINGSIMTIGGNVDDNTADITSIKANIRTINAIILSIGGRVEDIEDEYVQGVKGDAETNYRKGKVNLTLANLGYESVNNLSTTTTGKLLDARQGKALNTSILSISGQVEDIENNISNIEETATSTRAYAKNDYLTLDGVFYKVTQPIAIGDALTVGTNITETKIANELGGGGGGGVCYLGTCTTAAGTAAKAVTVSDPDFVLKTGTEIVVLFSSTNTASNPTLSVNGGTAKSIYYGSGVATTAKLDIAAGTANQYVRYVYDGTYFVWIGHSKDIDAGHTVLNTSGTALAQREKLQFSGMNVEDDSTNNKTIVKGQLVKVTTAQYEALTTEQKNDPNTTWQISDAAGVEAPVSTITIATTGWSNSTTTVDSVAYYTHETSLSSVFDAHPDIYLGALSTFPSNAEKQAYMCVDYVTVDASTNKLKCYARSKPSANFVLIVKGVSV